MDFPLTSTDQLTSLTRKNNIQSWDELTSFVRELPYGRNSNRADFSLVITENRGTCSSKHALLKLFADMNSIPDVSLILAIFRMNSENTPAVAPILKAASLDYIPEAHCYLQIGEKKIDFTSPSADYHRFKQDILTEQVILPGQVVEYKEEIHREYLRKWIRAKGVSHSFDAIWKIREKCIACLSGQHQ